MNAHIKRLAYLALLGGSAILCGGALKPLPTSAHSAEETVAFMLWGLEEGASTKRMPENRWETEEHDGGRSSIRIQRLTDCVFRIYSHVQRAGVPDAMEFEYVLNFAVVHNYRAWSANGLDQRVIVKIEGRSWYSKTVRNKTTGRVVYHVSAGNVDAHVSSGASVRRFEDTFAYFRSVFCGERSLSDTATAKSQ